MSLELVAQIKTDLQARGVNLLGPCGAFEITKRVAWALRAQGYGLIAKGGNNCQGFAVGAVILPTGLHFDILGDDGASNTPQWNRVNLDNGEPYLRPDDYRLAIDPGDALPPDAPAPPDPPAELVARVTALELLVKTLTKNQKQLDADREADLRRIVAIEDRPAPALPALVADGSVSLPFGLTKRVLVPVRLARAGDPK